MARGNGWMVGGLVAGTLGLGGALGLAPSLQAQDLAVGVKAGLNSGTIAWSATPLGEQLEDLERLNGIGLGATAELAGPRGLRTRLEALWTRKGFAQIEDGDRTTLSLRYLEIPLLLGWAFAPAQSAVSPQLYGGPWIAFETSCQAGLEAPTEAVEFDCDEVPGDPVLREKTDWGWAVGGLVDIAVSEKLHSQLDLRYTAGIRNVDGAPDFDNINARHRGLSVTVGLSLLVAP